MTIPVEPLTVPLASTPEGGLRVGQTRVSLDSVIHQFNNGASAEDIVSAFPSLKLRDVYAVIGYYLGHQTEVDAYLAERRQAAESLRNEVVASAGEDSTGIRDRLLARQARLSGAQDLHTP